MSPNDGRPAAGVNRSGPSDVSRQGQLKNTRKRSGAQHKLSFKLAPDGVPITVRGREAQALDLLINAGPHGVTSGEASPLGWARRTSHYVYRLRALGVPIVTVMEDASDARVGRYSFSGPLWVVTSEGAT
jgi:hypothetical protein